MSRHTRRRGTTPNGVARDVHRSYRVPVALGEDESILALFPLDLVMVPGLVLPLHIFEPRYRQLLKDVMARDEADQEFGIVAAHPLHASGLGAYPIGTTARVSEVDAYPDGRSDITTVGHRRFRINEIVEREPYLQARVSWLVEDTDAALESEFSRALALRAAALFMRYRGLMSEVDDGLDDLPDDPHLLSYVLTAATVLTTEQRQSLLELDSTDERLERACELLSSEIGVIRVLPSIPMPQQWNLVHPN